jgi:USP8 interacting
MKICFFHTLQLMIKRALSESGCPPHILDDLMENCHERRWPRGLSSLETRQNNRRIYDNYLCRRIPGEDTKEYGMGDSSSEQRPIQLPSF